MPVLAPIVPERRYDFPALLLPLPIRQYAEPKLFYALEFWQSRANDIAGVQDYFDRAIDGQKIEEDNAGWTNFVKHAA